jgi:hypothetical protein
MSGTVLEPRAFGHGSVVKKVEMVTELFLPDNLDLGIETAVSNRGSRNTKNSEALSEDNSRGPCVYVDNEKVTSLSQGDGSGSGIPLIHGSCISLGFNDTFVLEYVENGAKKGRKES